MKWALVIWMFGVACWAQVPSLSEPSGQTKDFSVLAVDEGGVLLETKESVRTYRWIDLPPELYKMLRPLLDQKRLQTKVVNLQVAQRADELAAAAVAESNARAARAEAAALKAQEEARKLRDQRVSFAEALQQQRLQWQYEREAEAQQIWRSKYLERAAQPLQIKSGFRRESEFPTIRINNYYWRRY